MENISPNWVQAGELGLAFVVIILCAWLVLYTMKTSAARETMLMKLIDSQQGKLTELSVAIQHMADGVSEVVDRLETIEAKINIPTTGKKKQKVS